MGHVILNDSSNGFVTVCFVWFVLRLVHVHFLIMFERLFKYLLPNMICNAFLIFFHNPVRRNPRTFTDKPRSQESKIVMYMFYFINKPSFKHKIITSKGGCVFLMIAVPMLPQAEFGRSDHREYALRFKIIRCLQRLLLQLNHIHLGYCIDKYKLFYLLRWHHRKHRLECIHKDLLWLVHRAPFLHHHT